jgi:hypothetical protein
MPINPDCRAFITGSHAYGTPEPDSDIDLCVLVDSDADRFLWGNAAEGHSGPLRFGKLNLVMFCVKERFTQWRDVTNKLKARAPVTRDEAIEAFQEAGFSSKDYQCSNQRKDDNAN